VILLMLAACVHGPSRSPWEEARSQPHWVETEDSAWTYLEHTPGEGPPVILVHGISSNRHFFDLQPDRSLVLALQEEGFDVWNMDLRGHGTAKHDPDGHRQKPGWSVDDYGLYDLPAAIAFVSDQTGEQPHFVVHSMGGMVLAVTMTRTDAQIASSVMLGSPLEFANVPATVAFGIDHGKGFAGLGSLPADVGAAALSLAPRAAPLGFDQMLYNPENIEMPVQRRMLRWVVSPVTNGEIRQFSSFAEHDYAFVDTSGDPYAPRLADVQTPTLFVAGRGDHIVQADQVRAFHDAMSQAPKGWVVAGSGWGMRHDYGHLDLVTGDNARDEVYPLIIDWLRRHP